MKFDPTKPVKGNDNQLAEIIYTSDEFLVALIGGRRVPIKFDLDGKSMEPKYEYLSLINIPEKHVRYINIYDDHESALYESRKNADNGKAKFQDRIACIRIEYEDGQFDD